MTATPRPARTIRPLPTQPAVPDPITAPADAIWAEPELDDPLFAFDGPKEDSLDPLTGDWLASALVDPLFAAWVLVEL